MLTPIRRSRGFTMIEVVISMALLAVLLMVLLYLFQVGTETWEKGIAQVNAYNTGRLLLDRIARDLKSAVLTYSAYFTGTARAVYFCTIGSDVQDEFKKKMILRGFWKYKAYEVAEEDLGRTEHAVMLYEGVYDDTGAITWAGPEQIGIYVKDLQFRYWGPYTLFWDTDDHARESRWGATPGMAFSSFTAPDTCPSLADGYDYDKFEVLGTDCDVNKNYFFLAYDRWDTRPGSTPPLSNTGLYENPLDNGHLPRAIRVELTVRPRYGFAREQEDELVLHTIVYIPPTE